MATIRAMISTKLYCKHVIEPYFTIDTLHPETEDCEQVRARVVNDGHTTFFPRFSSND